jgi:spoIIIJ-associated protein
MEQKLKQILTDLLDKLTVVYTDIIVKKDENDYYRVDIKTPETGLLIGFHSETIRSLELIVRLAAYRKTGERVKLILNVGDYLEKKEERLHFMADRMIERVKATEDGMVMFPFLTPGERRTIHLYLKDNEEVETVSDGEGDDRRLFLRLKKKEP